MSVFGLLPSNADGNAVVIEELGGRERKLDLQGGNTPDRGVEVRDRIRVHKHTYAHGAVLLHETGRVHDPLTFRGKFLDKSDFVIGGSRVRARILHSIVLARERVRVSWGQNIVREGLLSDLIQVNNHHNQIEYEFTLTVSSSAEEDETVNTALTGPFGKALLTVADALNSAQAAVEGLLDGYLLVSANARVLINDGPPQVPFTEFLGGNQRKAEAWDDSSDIEAALAEIRAAEARREASLAASQNGWGA